MKNRIALALLLAGLCGSILVTTVPRMAAQTTEFKLEDATPVKLRLKQNLSSADAQVGQQINFDSLDEVDVNGVTIIPKGAVAWGTVTEAQSKRRMGKGGKLNVNIDAVRMADGEKCPLRAVKAGQGGGHTGAMTAGIVATSLVVWPAAPFFLFMHGKDITIPEGTEITAYINGDMKLDAAKFGPGGSPAGAAPAASGAAATPAAAVTPASSGLTAVSIASDPAGADITVDGKFVGSTPSSLQLAPGDHAIRIEKSGYKAWQRTITLTAGASPTINATLEKQ